MPKRYIHDPPILDLEFRNAVQRIAGGGGIVGDQGIDGADGPPGLDGDLRVYTKAIVTPRFQYTPGIAIPQISRANLMADTRQGFDSEGTGGTDSDRLNGDTKYISHNYVCGRVMGNAGQILFLPRPIFSTQKTILIYKIYGSVIESFERFDLTNFPSGEAGQCIGAQNYWAFSIFGHQDPNALFAEIGGSYSDRATISLDTQTKHRTVAYFNNPESLGHRYPTSQIGPDHYEWYQSAFTSPTDWDGLRAERLSLHYGGPFGFYPGGCTIWWVHGYGIIGFGLPFPTPGGDDFPPQDDMGANAFFIDPDDPELAWNPDNDYGGGLFLLQILYLELDQGGRGNQVLSVDGEITRFIGDVE